MRPNKDEWTLRLAAVVALRSTCLRRHVGCVLVNSRGHVLATGYNGVAAGLPHCNEEKMVDVCFGPEYKSLAGKKSGERITHPNACAGATSPSGADLDSCQAIHAEQNALLQCRDVYEITSCYVTVAPCITCTKLLLNTSCQRIIYAEDYPLHAASKLWWEAAKREWIKLLWT